MHGCSMITEADFCLMPTPGRVITFETILDTVQVINFEVVKSTLEYTLEGPGAMPPIR